MLLDSFVRKYIIECAKAEWIKTTCETHTHSAQFRIYSFHSQRRLYSSFVFSLHFSSSKIAYNAKPDKYIYRNLNRLLFLSFFPFFLFILFIVIICWWEFFQMQTMLEMNTQCPSYWNRNLPRCSCCCSAQYISKVFLLHPFVDTFTMRWMFFRNL